MHSTNARQRITYKCLNSDPTGSVLKSSEDQRIDTRANKQKSGQSTKVEVYGNCTVSFYKQNYFLLVENLFT